MFIFYAFLTVLFVSFSAISQEVEYLKKNGTFATTYPWEAAESKEIRDWIKKFSIVEIGGFDEKESIERFIDELIENGVKPVIYEWMPAGYYYINGENNSFMETVYMKKDQYTLNPYGPFFMCSGDCQDYYFDLMNSFFLQDRFNYLSEQLNSIGAYGLFFDWASGRYILQDEYRVILNSWNERHPEKSYLNAVGDFYRNLRSRFPDWIIVTNQGFRNAKNVLPFVDYDVTESYATDVQIECCSNGDRELCRKINIRYKGEVYKINPYKTVYYPVSNDICNGSIDDTISWLEFLKEKTAFTGERFKGFIYLNYASPEYIKTDEKGSDGNFVYRLRTPKNAIYFGYSVPKLLGWESYTEVIASDKNPHRIQILEKDPVYQVDLGEPLGNNYLHIKNDDGNFYVRYYENGFVIVGEVQYSTCVKISSEYLKNREIYDLYSDEKYLIKDHTLKFHIKPEKDPLTGRMAPFGRVFVYTVNGKTPASICGDNRIYDCSLKCVDRDTAYLWLGDGFCDDGTWGINLLCPEFNNDGGDCN